MELVVGKLRFHKLGVSKNRRKNPKMDGENDGKPYYLMDDLGVPLFLETSNLLPTSKKRLGNTLTTIFASMFPLMLSIEHVA